MNRNFEANRLFFLSILLLGSAILLTACGLITSKDLPTPTVSIQEFSTPTPALLGDQSNPIILGFINPDDNQTITDAGNKLSRELAEYLTLSTQPKFYTDYKTLIDDLKEGKTQIVWLPPATYLFAHEKGIANVSLLSNHFGVYYYGTQFLANKVSGFTPSFNPVTGINNLDAKQALSQFKDKRPCWVGTDSLSGYYVPLGILNENEIPVLSGAFLQNHPAVIRALYIRGICDFGVTFAHLGDPRTASAVQVDLTDALDQIPVIFQTDAIIPNLSLAYSRNISQEMRKSLDAFFIAQVGDDSKRQTISSALDYEIQDLQKVDDSIFDRLRKILDASGADLQNLVGW
jgi:phosphonate transport system substrate-binding protein